MSLDEHYWAARRAERENLWQRVGQSIWGDSPPPTHDLESEGRRGAYGWRSEPVNSLSSSLAFFLPLLSEEKDERKHGDKSGDSGSSDGRDSDSEDGRRHRHKKHKKSSSKDRKKDKKHKKSSHRDRDHDRERERERERRSRSNSAARDSGRPALSVGADGDKAGRGADDDWLELPSREGEIKGKDEDGDSFPDPSPQNSAGQCQTRSRCWWSRPRTRMRTTTI